MIQIIGAVLGIGASLYSGYQANKSSKEQAKLLKKQGETLKTESIKDAQQLLEESERFASDQKMSYISSGVEFAEGSATDTVLQTGIWAQEEADSILARGEAGLEYHNASANIVTNTGRAQLISGYLQAAGQAANAIGSYQSRSAARSA